MDKKTFPQRMDDMVRWTGIPAFAAGKSRRRRPLRWFSLLAAVGAPAGFVISAAAGFHGRTMWVGYGILMAAFTIGGLLQVFGPLKPFGSGERVDEFDRAIRDRAYLFTFAAFAFATLLGIIFLMLMMVMQWPRAALVMCLSELALVLVTVTSAVPTAFASWSVEWHKDEG